MKKNKTIIAVNYDSKKKFKSFAAEKGVSMADLFDDITKELEQRKKKNGFDFFKI